MKWYDDLPGVSSAERNWWDALPGSEQSPLVETDPSAGTSTQFDIAPSLTFDEQYPEWQPGLDPRHPGVPQITGEQVRQPMFDLAGQAVDAIRETDFSQLGREALQTAGAVAYMPGINPLAPDWARETNQAFGSSIGQGLLGIPQSVMGGVGRLQEAWDYNQTGEFEPSALSRASESLRDWTQEVLPVPEGYEDHFAAGLGGGIGSMGAFMGLGLLGRGALGLAGRPFGLQKQGQWLGGFAAAGPTAGLAGVDQGYQTALNFAQENPELLDGKTPEEFALERGVNPLVVAAGVVQVANINRLIGPMFQGLGKKAGAKYLSDLGVAAGSEFTVETLGAVLQNVNERDYNVDRGLFDGAFQQGGYAALAAIGLRAGTMPYQNTGKSDADLMQDIIRRLNEGEDPQAIMREIMGTVDNEAMSEADRRGEFEIDFGGIGQASTLEQSSPLNLSAAPSVTSDISPAMAGLLEQADPNFQAGFLEASAELDPLDARIAQEAPQLPQQIVEPAQMPEAPVTPGQGRVISGRDLESVTSSESQAGNKDGWADVLWEQGNGGTFMFFPDDTYTGAEPIRYEVETVERESHRTGKKKEVIRFKAFDEDGRVEHNGFHPADFSISREPGGKWSSPSSTNSMFSIVAQLTTKDSPPPRGREITKPRRSEQAQAAAEQQVEQPAQLTDTVSRDRLPSNFDDPRLMRGDYRQSLQAMLGELRKGGEVTFMANPDAGFVNARGEQVAGSGDNIRTPSTNPEWFKSLGQNLFMDRPASRRKKATDKSSDLTVEQVNRAVDRALSGKKLGTNQAKIIDAMMTEIQGRRTEIDPQAGPTFQTWQDMLKAYRNVRKEARAAERGEPVGAEADALAEASDDALNERLGYFYDGEMYAADMDAEARALYDLYEQAALGNREQANAILQGANSESETIQALYELIEQGRENARNQALSQDQGPGAQERRAQQGQDAQAPAAAEGQAQDLAGPRSAAQQAQFDADQARRQRTDASPDMLQGAGELFAGARPEQTSLIPPKEAAPIEPVAEAQPEAAQPAPQESVKEQQARKGKPVLDRLISRLRDTVRDTILDAEGELTIQYSESTLPLRRGERTRLKAYLESIGATVNRGNRSTSYAWESDDLTTSYSVSIPSRTGADVRLNVSRPVQPETQADQAQPDFDEMVTAAARWRGAARNAGRGLDGREGLRHSKMTTKGDLDAYLMKRFGIDESAARDVSNELTRRNIPDDLNADPAEFAGEPWARETSEAQSEPQSQPEAQPETQQAQPEPAQTAAQNRQVRMLNRVLKEDNDDGGLDFASGQYGVYIDVDPDGSVKLRVQRLRTQYKGRVEQTEETNSSIDYDAVKDSLTEEARSLVEAAREQQMAEYAAMDQPAEAPTETQETAPLDANGSPIEGLGGEPVPVNPDGTITLYHRTTPETAERIRETGRFVSAENTNEAFFSTSREGQAEGYGDSVVEVRANPADVRIDDAFEGGEVHVAARVDRVRPAQGRVNYSFAGQRAQTADQFQLSRAQQRIESGENAETVRQETGWFRGDDGKWRFEIDDSKARYLPHTNGTAGQLWTEILSGVIDHPALFAAYPDLADMTVRTAAGMTNRGMYLPSSDEIIIAADLDSREQFSTLMHEVQHSIQQREGFAKGGDTSPSTSARVRNQLINEAIERGDYNLLREYETLIGQYGDHARAKEIIDLRNITQPRQLFNSQRWYEYRNHPDLLEIHGTPPRRNRLEYAQGVGAWIAEKVEMNARGGVHRVLREYGLQSGATRGDATENRRLLNNAYRRAERRLNRVDRDRLQAASATKRQADQLAQVTPDEAYQLYRRLAGEIEARNVQARQGMNVTERRETSPEQTRDVPASEAVILWNGREMASAPANAGQPMTAQSQPSATPESFRSALGRRTHRALTESGLMQFVDGFASVPGNHPANAAAVYVDGTAYINTRMVAEGAETGLVLHEIGTHVGMKDFLGQETYDRLSGQLQRQIERGQRADAPKAARQAWEAHRKALVSARAAADYYKSTTKKDMPQAQFDSVLMEETWAYMGQDGADSSLWQRFVSAIKTALIRMGLSPKWVNGLNNSDIAALARGSVARVVDQVAEGQASLAPAMYQSAYHGTPYLFDRFSLSKIGTGEGVQAYGWGLYFAGRRAVGEYYRDALTDRQPSVVTVDGEQHTDGSTVWDGGDAAGAVYRAIAFRALKDADGDVFQAKQQVRNRKLGMTNPRAQETAARRAVELLEQLEGKQIAIERPPEGSLYQVNIPENDTLLDYDKTLSEQPEAVRAIIERILPEHRIIQMGRDQMGFVVDGSMLEIQNGGTELTGRELYRMIGINARQGDSLREQNRAASQALNEAGIPGLRYLDGPSRNRPLREIKREFLAEVPQDAEFDDVMELLGTGVFSSQNEAILRALDSNDWLGFDYPAQAISAALGGNVQNWDPSPELLKAISDAQGGGTHNYVIWDENTVTIEAINDQQLQADTLRYSKNFDALDAQHRAAVESGDMETAQRLVDEAARAAGFDVGPLYHGTDAEFTEFRHPEWTKRDSGFFGRGFYFIDDMVAAEEYADSSEAGGDVRLVEAYLSLKNPYRWNGRERNPLGNPEERRAFEAFLDENGHDGVIVEGGMFDGEYMVRNPSQIKSAEAATYDDAGNLIPLSERFNQASGDIRYSVQRAVDLANEKFAETRTKSEEKFFQDFWPKLLRRTGLRRLATPRNIGRAVAQAIKDIETWLRDNPRFMEYYESDMAATREVLAEYFPDITSEQFEFFRAMLGVTSPSTMLPSNVNEAILALDIYQREGNFDAIEMGVSEKGNVIILDSPISFSNATAPNKARSLKVLERLVNEQGGMQQALDYLKEMVPVKELHAFNQEMGYKGRVAKIGQIRALTKAATGQDTMVPRAFIFGSKVGAYTLNTMGDGRFTTIDIWESRFIRSYFADMFGDKRTGLPADAKEHALFEAFNRRFKAEMEKAYGQEFAASALQAMRWFYILNAAQKAGYTGAKTNQTISEYSQKSIERLRARDRRDGRPGNEAGQARYSIAQEGVGPPQLSFPAERLPDNIKVVPTHSEAAAAVFENGQGIVSQEHAGPDAEMLALQMAGFGQNIEDIIGRPFARRLDRMEGTLAGILGDSALRQDSNVQNALRRARKHLKDMGIEATDQQAAWYLQGVAMSPEGRFVVPPSPNLNTGQGRQIGDPIPEAYDPEKDFPILRDKRGPMLAWTRFFESAADNFEQTSGLEYLGQPIRDYFDGELKYKAEALNVLRPALQAFGRLPGRLREFAGLTGAGPTQRQVETAFGNYFKAVTYGDDAQAVYDRAPQVAKDLIDAWRKVGEMTGDMNQQLGVQVKDGNKWRPIGRVPIYFPRMLSDDTRATLANPAKNPEHWNRLVDALMAGDYIKSRDEAVEYIKAQAVPTESQNDYFTAMEVARKQALPDVFYDWSIVPALKYVDAWATRYSQIEQFGQATDSQKDLFDQALDSGVLDEHTRKYIRAAQKRIYEYAAVNGWQTGLATFNMIATGSQLANFGTALLNLIGGSTLNWMTYGEIASLKAYAEIIRHPLRSFRDMREIGVLREDFLKIFQDHGEDRIFSIFGKSVSPSRALSRAVTLMMKYGGYLPTEHVIRMHGGLVGKHYLLRARKAYADNPSSRQTRQFRAFVERNNFDFDRLMREDGKYFEKWLRFTSNLTQGTYRVDQSPIYTDTPEGRFFLKYQKFGTQVNRLVWKESLEPFVKSTLGKGETLSTGERVRTFWPMARFFYAAAAGGAAIGLGRQALFDYIRRGPQEDELEEALKDDDRARKLAVLFSYAYHQMNTAGAFGFIGNYAQMFRDFTQQERVKNPLDPPGLAALDAAADIATKLVGQGEYSLRDLDETLERFFSLYRTSKRPLIKALGMVDEENRLYRIQSAERDRKYISGVTARFAKDQGIEGARTMMGGRFMPSERTPTSKAIIDSIRAGDHGRARAIYREAMRDAGEDRRKVQNSIRASVRNAQPMKMHGKVMSEREQREFLRWARDHVGDENYERIRRAHEDYVRAASRAGVM